MSYWTRILGVVDVSPMGRTQHEKTYILNTVLDHLPAITGSEKDMNIAINIGRENGSSSHDEFGMRTNNLTNCCGDRDKNGWLRTADNYYLTIYGDFRDRMFNQTFREFQKWLCRLAKRVDINHVSVTILSDDHKPYHIEKYGWINNPYADMFEMPSWVKGKDSEGEPTWCEYLMWEMDPYSGLPLQHMYKYVESDEVDREMERRESWRDKRIKKWDRDK